ncbi:DNA-3-methyladenine glycosylase I [Neiella marina]|uniref:DNA-3-methyladenine glycosylase I n=1 Tax=Neiella holothuriorum TaxID=2870530 RepID=A0ABS7EKC0_9GAMM|nr:DNA-3-methyladenine glycosylase I [Neiella holothuriorum]MBW8192766.1 DNA-3-methyladenine glycosylase I [Neiella holothuriorum]
MTVLHNQGDCHWPGTDSQYRAYHDQHWGVAEYNSQQLFEKLCLDGQQAGLSWLTILRKQTNFQLAFANFDPAIIAKWGDAEVDVLMTNAGIIRSRAKINAILTNARAYLQIEKGNGEFAKWLWGFVGHRQIDMALIKESEMQTESAESVVMAKALKKAGFKFVGPTICYAFMQAVGMVNDHLVTCHCYESCKPSVYPW